MFECYLGVAYVHGIQGQILYLCDAADLIVVLHIVEQDLRLCELLCYIDYINQYKYMSLLPMVLRCCSSIL